MAFLVNRIVPAKAIQGVLNFTNVAGHWLADVGDMKIDAEVDNISECRTKNLRVSDNLTDEVHNWAIGAAVVEGRALGRLAC